jgi:acetyltransferase-like isoleucine patch superfamily enzyme
MIKKTKKFIDFLRRSKWDLEGRRFLYKQALLSWIPSYIGYTLRGRFYRKYLKSMGEETLFLERVYIRNPQNFSVGRHCSIGIDCALQAAGGLTLGDYVILGPGVKIWTSNHIYADPNVPIYDQGSEFKEVVIGDDTWVGANVFIMPGAHIGKGCVISAGAVVGGKTYKDYSILAGNPARVIGFRNQQASSETPSPNAPKEG